jgi:3-phosphoshikimate 1-carboxyvinyltransferase
VEYDKQGHHWFTITGPQTYHPFEFTIPSDWSSVAFPVVAAMTPGSELVISDMDFQDVQGDAVVIDHLIAMGADITKDLAGSCLLVRGGAPLKSIPPIDMAAIPDALPILALAGALCEGVTVLDNVAGTRLKETDRAAVMREFLGKMGVRVEEEPNRLTIYGGSPLQGTVLDSYDDHRIAMTAVAAGAHAQGETQVLQAQCAGVTFPGFFEKMKKIGTAIV